MKKKLLSSLLALTMVVGMFAGCGGGEDATAGGDAPVNTEAAGGEQKDNDVAEPQAEGKVLNIYCWNDEFQRRIKDHYAGYTEVDATHGKIGDIEVVWNITANADNAYQNNLDETLLRQETADADAKVDIFLVEADYALKYIDSPYAMAISDLGITDADLANQYQYTKDIVTDSNGVLKGLSWQGCPGALFYNREAAKAILGSDDAETVQAAVKDWDTFTATAEKAKAAGTHALWSNDWSAGFFPEGKVFCYFGPAWFINFSMSADVEGSVGYNGGWGITEGPQGFFWGGTWICAAAGTDNAATIKDIMLQMTTNETVMKEIVVKDDDFVNNKPAMEAMAKDTSYSSKILGGVNPLSIYCAGAGSIDLSNLSAYDQACNEEFQNAMKNYFEGNATLDEALDLFYKAVVEKHPELTY